MQADPYSLKHYGVLGMHWGIRKAEDLIKTEYRTAAGENKKGHKTHVELATKTRARVAGVRRKPNGSLGFFAKRKVDKYQKQADKYEVLANNFLKRAELAIKQANTTRLSDEDLATKREVFNAALTAAVLSAASMATAGVQAYGAYTSKSKKVKTIGYGAAALLSGASTVMSVKTAILNT